MEGKILNSSDYVYYKSGNSIMSGGMKIDNMYLNENIPAMVRLGREHNNLMVPMGLIQLNAQYGGNNKSNIENYKPDTSNQGTISNSLYDKLLNMAEGGGKKAIAKRKSNKKNKSHNKEKKSKNKKRKTRKKKRSK
jgi:hypothetical protein